jgi:alpha-1,2-mannosyltransferase
MEREGGYPWIPVLAVLLLHFHAYGTRAAIHLLDRSWAVLVQPGVYGTVLLVGLAAGRLYTSGERAPASAEG